MKKILNRYDNGRISLVYILDTETGVAGMTLLPGGSDAEPCLDGEWRMENLTQLKLVGDAYPDGFSAGATMRNSESCNQLKYAEQCAERSGNVLLITTLLKGPRVTARHTAELPDGRAYVSVRCAVRNTSGEAQKLEMISSFSLCGLPAAGAEERMAELNLYRLQSRWSGEGKLQKQSLTELHMEPSWSRLGVNSLRWGQIGSMPVRGYFPWAVLEDARYGVMTGAQLYYNGSWQMELYERDDKVALSGGLADREFGHYLKALAPGEELETPEAVIAACRGDLDDLCACLAQAQEDALDAPETEEELPLIFNEYCTTWGNPTAENIEKILGTIRGKGFRYFVIDAGWYSIGDGVWYNDQGDWNVNKKRFPEGLKAVADRIREAGMIPGIWFEYECIGSCSEAYKREELQLKRDGIPVSDAGKRFWNMTLEPVTEYLDEKVIGQLRDNGFGYIKVDYNGNIGIGPDGKDGFGEELRRTVTASREYFMRMREKLPGLVIENCASGGHRLEPSMMGVCSMASFSDAHECVTIPIIAANLHRAILPRQSQIWAVLRADDGDRRLVWSLAAGLLGRLCVSGDVYDLSERQWAITEKGLRFYREAAPVIREGISRKQGGEIADYSRPAGYQALVREGKGAAAGETLVVVHCFDGMDGTLSVSLPENAGQIVRTFAEDGIRMEKNGNGLTITGLKAYSAAAALLRRD